MNMVELLVVVAEVHTVVVVVQLYIVVVVVVQLHIVVVPLVHTEMMAVAQHIVMVLQPVKVLPLLASVELVAV